MEKDLDTPLM
jgi:Ca2+-transporting ATPase